MEVNKSWEESRQAMQIFQNEQLNLKVRALRNEDGSISINAEDTAIGFGWYKTESKNGKNYTSIRWSTINGFCKELGFANLLSKDDYIPESLFYMLGMKAKNEVAQEFQKWLAMDVLPSIRKTGSYKKEKIQKSDEEKKLLAEAKVRNARAREASLLCKIADKVELPTYKQIMLSKATAVLNNGQPLIPLPKAERKTYSAKEIGDTLGISANMVGKLANKHNLKIKEYGSLYRDKSKYSNKEVDTFRYYDTVIPVLRNLI